MSSLTPVSATIKLGELKKGQAGLIVAIHSEALAGDDSIEDLIKRLMEMGLLEGSRVELVHEAPHTAPVRRLDEATAARQPNLRWRAMTGIETPCPD